MVSETVCGTGKVSEKRGEKRAFGDMQKEGISDKESQKEGHIVQETEKSKLHYSHQNTKISAGTDRSGDKPTRKVVMIRMEIRVRDHIDQTIEYSYRMRPETPFLSLFRKYHEKMSAPMGSFRFLFDGYRIGDEDTPKKLEMENKDTIDAIIFAIGGSR